MAIFPLLLVPGLLESLRRPLPGYCFSLDLHPRRRRSGFGSVLWLGTASLIYPSYAVCPLKLHNTANFALARRAYGRPPTCATQKKKTAHMLSHTGSHIKMSVASLGVSDSGPLPGGCWISLLQLW